MAEDASEPNALKKLLALSDQLKAANIHHEITRYREDGVSIIANVPGERWEIDVLEAGEVDFERFVSDGGVAGEHVMNQAIAKWAEPAGTV